VIEQVTNGGADMPPFKNTLSEQQIKNVAAYAHPRSRSKDRVVVAMRRRGRARTTPGRRQARESFDA